MSQAITLEQREQALTKLAARLAEVEAQRDEFEQLASSLKTAIRELAPEPGEYRAGRLRIQIGTNRRFNETKARALLRPDLHELVTKTALDPAKVRALFPDVFEAAQTTFDNKVSLKTAPPDQQ